MTLLSKLQVCSRMEYKHEYTAGLHVRQQIRTSQVRSIVNSYQLTAICFPKISWMNEFGRITGYLVLFVHYTGFGTL